MCLLNLSSRIQSHTANKPSASNRWGDKSSAFGYQFLGSELSWLRSHISFHSSSEAGGQSRQ